MRADLPQLLTERPRRGSSATYRSIRNRNSPRYAEEDELASTQGMRRPHLLANCEKETSDYLAPMRRFLNAQVGRRWDDIYAEICRECRVTSTVQAHVRLHIGSFVICRPIRLRDGQLADTNGRPLRKFRRHDLLYVCPATGLLSRVADLPQAQTARAGRSGSRADPLQTRHPTAFWLAADRELRRVGDIWQIVKHAPLPPSVPGVAALLHGTDNSENALAGFGPGHWIEPIEPGVSRIMALRAQRRFDVLLKRWIVRGERAPEGVPAWFADNTGRAVRYAASLEAPSPDLLDRYDVLNARA